MTSVFPSAALFSLSAIGVVGGGNFWIAGGGGSTFGEGNGGGGLFSFLDTSFSAALGWWTFGATGTTAAGGDGSLYSLHTLSVGELVLEFVFPNFRYDFQKHPYLYPCPDFAEKKSHRQDRLVLLSCGVPN